MLVDIQILNLTNEFKIIRGNYLHKMLLLTGECDERPEAKHAATV